MTKPDSTLSVSHPPARSAAFIITFFLSLISAPGAYAQSRALDQLPSDGGTISLPAPEASAVSLEDQAANLPPRSAGRESLRIIRMSDEAVAAATPDQKIGMLKTLMRDSNPNQNNSENTDWDQKDIEKTILRVLSSARDAASFDYIYYRLDKGTLERSVGWYKDVRDLVNKHRGTVVPGDWDGLTRYVDTVAKATHSGRNFVKFLVDGKNFLPEITRELSDARSSIHIEVFQLQADDIGQGLADILSAKAKAGLKVRLMIDEHGSKAEHDPALVKMLDSLRASGVQVIVKKPTAAFEGHLDHRKVVVIDGRTAFTGGMNLGRTYQVDWHDQQTLIKGPAVTRLQEAFLERWTAAGGRIETGEDLRPFIEEYPGGSETQVITHVGWDDQNIKAMYLRAIGTAQKSIRIASPYFTDEDVVDALRAAARRGVNVRLELPRENNIPVVQRASRANYPKLVKAGVQVYEYKGRMAHEKVAVIDGRWATFGSSNLDERSLKNNDELNLIVTDPRVAEEIETSLFEADLPNCDLMNSYSPDALDHIIHLFSGML